MAKSKYKRSFMWYTLILLISCHALALIMSSIIKRISLDYHYQNNNHKYSPPLNLIFHKKDVNPQKLVEGFLLLSQKGSRSKDISISA